MDSLYLSISGFYLEINFAALDIASPISLEFKARIMKTYSGFISKKIPKKMDFLIKIEHEDSLRALHKLKDKDFYLRFYKEGGEGELITFDHLSDIQFKIVIRTALQKLLVKQGGFILHASGSDVSGKAVIFLGDSGAGKSTAMKILNKKFPALADDSIIIRKVKNQYLTYQTPFIEKNAWVIKNLNGFRTGAVMFLNKAENNKLVKVVDKESIAKLFLSQLLTEESDLTEQVKNALKFINSFNGFYQMHFSLKDNPGLVKLFEKLK